MPSANWKAADPPAPAASNRIVRSRPLRRLRPAAYQLCGRVRRQNAVCAGCLLSAKLAKLDVPVHEVLGAPPTATATRCSCRRHRRKRAYCDRLCGPQPSHRPCADCKLQPDWMNALAARACTLLEETASPPTTRKPTPAACAICTCVRAGTAGQRLLCFVVNGNGLPNEAEICATLQKEFDLTTILINRNNAAPM